MTRRDRIALSGPMMILNRGWLHIIATVRDRRARPLLSSIAIPLAMTASMLLQLWWIWAPLILCAWWWADRQLFRWSWLVTIEAGAIGAQWAYLGTYAIATWPRHLILLGALWALYPLLIAVAALAARRMADTGTPYAGY